jgi:hypothetical protein
MVGYLTIDNLKIEEGNFGSLLAIYRLLPSFKRELAIDRVIAAITLEPEEINLALQQFQQRYKLGEHLSLALSNYTHKNQAYH